MQAEPCAKARALSPPVGARISCAGVHLSSAHRAFIPCPIRTLGNACSLARKLGTELSIRWANTLKYPGFVLIKRSPSVPLLPWHANEVREPAICVVKYWAKRVARAGMSVSSHAIKFFH